MPGAQPFIFSLLYVDDILIVGNHLCDVNELKSLLNKEFDMKDLGPQENSRDGDSHEKEIQTVMALTTRLC